MRSASESANGQADDACADDIGPDLDNLPACSQPDCSQLTVDEVGSAIAHQVTEPLTALLLYLHELKRTTASAGPSVAALPAIIDSAIGEAERACAIIERVSESFQWSGDLELAIVRGRQAIRWLKRGGVGEQVSGDQRPAFACLTARERQVLDLVSSGASSKEGALRLKISPRTFEAHRAQVMRKLGARNTAELVRMVFVGSLSA
jgi:DNA-binding CsgD family transcriptional regulator